MILWTCPQKCGHYPNTNFICKIAVMHIYTSKYSHWLLPMVCYIAEWHRKYKWMMHVHISTHKLLQNCSYEYDPPVHKDVSPVHIYMTAVNVHRSNLRKTGVLKLLQDKTNFNKNTNISDSPNILTDKPPKILKYSVFS